MSKSVSLMESLMGFEVVQLRSVQTFTQNIIEAVVLSNKTCCLIALVSTYRVSELHIFQLASVLIGWFYEPNDLTKLCD